MASIVVWRGVAHRLLCAVFAGLLCAAGPAQATCSYDGELRAWFPDGPVTVGLTSPANGSSYTVPVVADRKLSHL
jgi:hypothetical protein